MSKQHKTPFSNGNGHQLSWGAPGTAGATIAAGLVFENVSHDYDGVSSVQDMSLAIAPGEILCLLGQSGCGKTTLMRIAAGVERQSRGRVLINGREVAGDGVFLPPEKRGVGLMFQDYALFPHMSILDNVMFGLTNMPKKAAQMAALGALRRVGLADYAADYPHSLSGGEQQRVALARALVPRPGILLMDEPFSGLDKRLRDSVRDETLAVIRETRATCIIVTHDPEEAMRMGDKIALMRHGRLVQHGTAAELYREPVDLFAARFFSELNQLEGVVSDAGIETPLGILSGEGLRKGGKVDVCVRPQGLLLHKDGLCGVSGRIRSRRFVGEVDLLTIVVDGLDYPLQARVRAGSLWENGMDVCVTTDPKDVLVFERGAPQI
ncbi:ABC transporter ATP-binding protein [Roseibium salinum]|uniref:ABC transporter ATP-binding protein n=1 Tax=Roseibium salinum TaxID=1604349 RepID=A0ABT3R0Q1_9HYPH|nr:ABC transporter ATP-binding protein [Roseibium sp. DSM 29163]MCX2722796.1 ABC transporter ATP-binding protein [Roseibium sp. DSM 29163]